MSGWTWADVAGEAKPRTATVELILDGDLVAEIEDAQRRAAEAARSDDTLDRADVAEARAEVERLEAAAVDACHAFTVRSVGWRRWRELCEAHPPSEGGARWDPATFVPAVLLECVDQFTSGAEVAQALDMLSTAQVAQLFNRARRLNEGGGRVPT